MTGARAAALVLLLAALLVAPSAAPSAQPGDPVSAIVSENTELANATGELFDYRDRRFHINRERQHPEKPTAV